jgi:hypothetical protein
MPFTVTYNGNASDGGSPPVDPRTYNPGETVPVQPAGSMTRTGATFAYWKHQPRRQRHVPRVAAGHLPTNARS